MNENEQKAGSVADQKSKIRERYKGINPDELDVIPALPQEDIFAVENEQRVAVYARVSTDDPRQTSSYELQKNHYHDVISKSPNWKLVQIYADEEERRKAATLSIAKRRFQDMIDELFSYTRKKIDRKSNDIVFYQDGERLLPYKLSSGEKQMLVILLTVLVHFE